MATVKKQPRKKIEPKKKLPTKAEMVVKYIQFSKRMTAFILIFWAIYRSAQLVVGVIEPSIASSLVRLSSGIDTVAIAFGITYTSNSIAEKITNAHKEVQKMMYTNIDDVSSSNSKDSDTDEDIENG